jgi:hypothetical protein
MTVTLTAGIVSIVEDILIRPRWPPASASGSTLADPEDRLLAPGEVDEGLEVVGFERVEQIREVPVAAGSATVDSR